MSRQISGKNRKEKEERWGAGKKGLGAVCQWNKAKAVLKIELCLIDVSKLMFSRRVN